MSAMVQDLQPVSLQASNMYFIPEKASFPARSSSMSSLRDSANHQAASVQVEHVKRNELSSSMRDLSVTSSTPINGHPPSHLSKSQPSSLPRLAVDNLGSSSQSPPSADALHIQRTYQRISRIGGIPRDGFVEGVELTRERKSEATINGYLSPRLHGHAEDDEGEGTSSGRHGKVFGDFLSADDGVDEQGRRKNSAPSSRKVSGATTNSVRTRQEEQEEEEQQEYRFLEKVDRYGFFEPTYGKYSRLALLSRKECLELPPNKLAAKGKVQANGAAQATDKKGKRRSLLVNGNEGSTPAPGSPYLSVPTPNTSGASSLASSTMSSNLRASRNGGPSAASLTSSIGPGGVPNNTTTPLSTLAKENSRTNKWFTEMLTPSDRDSGGNIIQWKLSDKIIHNEKRLRRRVAKGIPDIWRAAAWEALILRTEDQAGYSSKRKKSQMNSRETIKRFYDLVLEPCAHDVQIDLDVPRTISGHLYFHTRYGLGQRALFNVLHAFALLCSDCGYCQGMGSLAATFLCYLPPEKAYAAMVAVHDSYDLHTIYSPGFPGMLECFAVQERLVEILMPDVHQVFERNYITPSSFATKWYITLFSNCISFSTQLRIYDLFLLYGLDFLIVLSTAIIWSLKRYIVDKKADFESILSLLSSFFVPEDEDKLLRWACKLLKRRDITDVIRETRLEWQRKEGQR